MQDFKKSSTVSWFREVSPIRVPRIPRGVPASATIVVLLRQSSVRSVWATNTARAFERTPHSFGERKRDSAKERLCASRRETQPQEARLLALALKSAFPPARLPAGQHAGEHHGSRSCPCSSLPTLPPE